MFGPPHFLHSWEPWGPLSERSFSQIPERSTSQHLQQNPLEPLPTRAEWQAQTGHILETLETQSVSQEVQGLLETENITGKKT